MAGPTEINLLTLARFLGPAATLIARQGIGFG